MSPPSTRPLVASHAPRPLLERMLRGELALLTPDRGSHRFTGRLPGRSAELTIRDWAAVRHSVLSGDIGLAEAYRAGQIDCRDIKGRYDHVVSIEMLEAAGERGWPTGFGVLRKWMKPGGSARGQGVTIADEHFTRYRRGIGFIPQYLFPGGMLPSPTVLANEIATAGLSLVNRFAFGHDYAETLRRWAQAFEDALPSVHVRGFDEAFVPLWRFYPACCEAGFSSGRTDVW
ncbi:class I SAM-dependent methyltransferase [Crenobacter cavernae]|uniref:Uncharacterized protein n=1 Tax=Crenobacter cavernae TaxID=2290923 RepID=A0A345Y367_9NEIS|nr:class I SAM-dependent methyltransferase [Crenobacter cavernae]AXK38369.1 hypothetical protein DWG20_02405 [Crenobacter cavernae]